MTKKAIILVCTALMLTGCSQTGEGKTPATTTTTGAVTTTTEAATTTTAALTTTTVEVTTTATTTTEVTTASVLEEPVNCTVNIDGRELVFTYDILVDTDDPNEICDWLMGIMYSAGDVIKEINEDYDSYKVIAAGKGSELCVFEYDKDGNGKGFEIIDPVANHYFSMIAYDPDEWYIEIDKEEMINNYKQSLGFENIDSEHVMLNLIFPHVKVYYADKTEVTNGLIEIEILGEDGEKYVAFDYISDGVIWPPFDGDFLYNHGLKDIKVVGVAGAVPVDN